MHASIAISTAMGLSLLAGLFGAWLAIRSVERAARQRDTAVSILFAIAGLLVVLTMTAAGFIAARGMEYFYLLKAALLLTALFAVAGMAFGLQRALRGARIHGA